MRFHPNRVGGWRKGSSGRRGGRLFGDSKLRFIRGSVRRVAGMCWYFTRMVVIVMGGILIAFCHTWSGIIGSICTQSIFLDLALLKVKNSHPELKTLVIKNNHSNFWSSCSKSSNSALTTKWLFSATTWAGQSVYQAAHTAPFQNRFHQWSPSIQLGPTQSKNYAQ